jgi:hypothetical protein
VHQAAAWCTLPDGATALAKIVCGAERIGPTR